jgi:hypothetical protein
VDVYDQRWVGGRWDVKIEPEGEVADACELDVAFYVGCAGRLRERHCAEDEPDNEEGKAKGIHRVVW